MEFSGAKLTCAVPVAEPKIRSVAAHFRHRFPKQCFKGGMRSRVEFNMDGAVRKR